MPVLSLPPLSAAIGTQYWSNLPGAALSLAIAEAASTTKRFTLVLTTNSQNAERLRQELSFFAPDLPMLYFPDWGTLPYDLFSPNKDITSQRIANLYHLPELTYGVLVVQITTALHRLAPTKFLLGNSLVLNVKQKLDVEKIRAHLEASGYYGVDIVREHGEFAVRGALIDLFPMGSKLPYRIDLLDDEIKTLRTFDPNNQHTISKVDSIKLLPAWESMLQKDAVIRFKARFCARFNVDCRHYPLLQDLSSGITPAGIEYYLPLFFDETSTLFNYLPRDTQVFSLPGIKQAAENFWKDVRNRYEERRVDNSRPVLLPAELFLSVDDCFASLKYLPHVIINQQDVVTGDRRERFPADTLPNLTIQAKAAQPLEALSKFLGNFSGRILFTAESAGRHEILLELLEHLKLRPKNVDSWLEFVASKERLAITITPLDEGLLLDKPSLALIAESLLFGEHMTQRRNYEKRVNAKNNAMIKDLTELRDGMAVVHIDHGVGRYLGMQILEIDNEVAEFITIEYAESAKLYVPVTSLHLIAPYTGSDGALAPLHRLGSETWQKAKHKAAEQIRDVAAELLDIYAHRAACKGHAFADPKVDYATFSAGFAFEETPDQQITIEAVRADMLAPKPMDRLVCGDVGFGKTEVAMRAAFIAVHDGKQVAILVPTTLLAQQHYNSFRDRFAGWPVTIEVMSRFKSFKEANAVIADLAEGKIDIVIGTHKLLSNNIKIKNLGLVVIDEEHRFGVRQKEQLKALRSEVDILTLTATPIPRTLNITISGMRDLSIIATPPARRLAVRSFVIEHNKRTIKEALLRELLRGGQVYYLYNDVKTIEKCAANLVELVPEARIAIGHGQMLERELEQVMSDFYHKRFNVLVASTIIETGIDVPSASTIIIERADKFGLAQLHQLRGRVGRSHHQAYAYFLTPPRKQITGDAERRLEAIVNTQELGAGFVLATNDLEIRGAGELLGDGQSGQIQAIGFTLYMNMLERAVKAIRNGQQLRLDQPMNSGPEINLRLPALIPEDYLPDVHTRLILYKRIASITDEKSIQDIQVEMIDRFGLLPEPTKNLVRLTLLKLQAEQLGIKKIDAGPKGARIEFEAHTPVDPSVLIQLIQDQPNRYKFEGATLFKFIMPMEYAKERFNAIETLFKQLIPQPD
ncbi:transcription-repair coupling factor [Candidatus Pseudomonas adelgestsugas]|uniref:Transcription-repair-coupling factor n=1 Tax=Candidatus Pseudomonas adelgestsugas TaxID=1302376 RepID=A0ABX5RA67_9PSED|nr:transcription-repair coupling factor [Candidatus Pseudomonas adelgestsugas]QAX82035.1 Transcription-repair-coupling factor [Candidatus Pseudomonas adelgestsugas]